MDKLLKSFKMDTDTDILDLPFKVRQVIHNDIVAIFENDDLMVDSMRYTEENEEVITASSKWMQITYLVGPNKEKPEDPFCVAFIGVIGKETGEIESYIQVTLTKSRIPKLLTEED